MPSSPGSKDTSDPRGGRPERTPAIAHKRKGEEEKEEVVVYGLSQWQYYVVPNHVCSNVPATGSVAPHYGLSRQASAKNSAA